MTKLRFWCPYCGYQQAVKDPMKCERSNDGQISGDVVCKKCQSVITTITTDEPGEYEFVKIKAKAQ